MKALGFIGSGNMAEAILRAVLAKGIAGPGDVVAADPAAARREVFAALGVETTDDNRVVAAKAATIVLSCKPQQMREVLEGIRESLRPGAVVVSIAAGIPVSFITGVLGVSAKVIRVMPNTPLMVGEGMSALAAGPGVGEAELEAVRGIFASAGMAVLVPEELMDAVTAVSGSGPAYYFLLTEHLAKAAVELGFDAETAQTLARQTALGSALMLARSAELPEELRRKVTSPGGTTQAAIEHLEAAGMPGVFRKAVERARDRGRELGKK